MKFAKPRFPSMPSPKKLSKAERDSTLLEIYNRKPQALDERGQISGIGQAKLQKYGDAFLQVLEENA